MQVLVKKKDGKKIVRLGVYNETTANQPLFELTPF